MTNAMHVCFYVYLVIYTKIIINNQNMEFNKWLKTNEDDSLAGLQLYIVHVLLFINWSEKNVCRCFIRT